MKVRLRILVFSLLAIYGCELDDPNKKPKINLSSSTNGLIVELSGSVTDDGKIAKVDIIWGDSHMDFLSGVDFKNINKSHHYSERGSYTITISATDNSSEISTQTIDIEVDFAPTNLNGVKPGIYKADNNEYLVLTLNLHTYQELYQQEKLNLIVDAIGLLEVDFVLFQECAQHKNSPIINGTIRDDNMALLISQGIKEKYGVDYSFIWDWAHYGWDVWEEGVAVLSKHSLVSSESRYISSNTSTTNIASRKVIHGSYEIPSVGRMNLYSAHTHWRTSTSDEEQNNQIKNIKFMVEEKALPIASQNVVSIVGGDFNGNPTSDYPWSEGYNTMMLGDLYTDSFLEIYPDANNKPAQSIYYTIGGSLPGRIDYIFMKKNPYVSVVESQIIFTENIIGRVSDHYGVITKFRQSK